MKNLFIACCFAPFFIYSQSGTLDNTFGTGGIATTSVGTNNDYGQSVAIQTDGKIVIAGSSGADFGIVRYNTNGTLDNTFGTAGKIISSIGAANDVGNAMALQADGKIIVGGYTGIFPAYDFTIARYNTNGTIDNTFGTGGSVTSTVLAAGDVGRAITIQADGKIIMAGNADNGSNSDIALVRYNTNGTLDNTFDTDGRVTTPVGTANDIARSVIVQSDGKILITGYSYTSASFSYDFVLCRYNANGSLDNTFGTGGIVTTSIVSSANDYGETILLQPDGRIIVGGYSFTGFVLLARYNSNGTLDNTFGTAGKVSTAFTAAYQNNYSTVLQSDGKIIVGGFCNPSATSSEFGLIRYNNDGSIDNTWGTTGTVTTAIGTTTDIVTSLAIQSDGKVVAAGSYHNGTNFDFAVARYNNTIATGVNDSYNEIQEMTLLPNPAINEITIKTNLKAGDKGTVVVKDIKGRKLYEGELNSETKIDVSNFANGTYVASIYLNGSLAKVKKFVKVE